jgi:hypothetical protein
VAISGLSAHRPGVSRQQPWDSALRGAGCSSRFTLCLQALWPTHAKGTRTDFHQWQPPALSVDLELNLVQQYFYESHTF